MAGALGKTQLHAQNARDYKKVPNIKVDGILGQEKGDFGGNFTSYTPPTPRDLKTDIRVVEDTHTGGTGSRLYFYGNGAWYFHALTKI